MRSFLNYTKNRVLYNLLRFAILFILLLIGSQFLFIPHVHAANLENMSFTNRTQDNFPFTTYYDAAHYSGQYYLFNGATDLPSYAIVSTCATGPLTFSITNQQGNLSYMGYVDLGGSCSITGSQYSGSVYVYYFNLVSYTDAGNGNMGINYSMTVAPDVNYIVWVEFNSISFSSSSDFTTALQNQTLIQNQNKLNNQQVQTNQKLDNIDVTLNDETLPDNPDFSNLDTADDTPISDLVLMPINYMNKLVNAFSGSCKTYTIDFGIFNSDFKLNLPCINTEQWLGSSVWHIIDLFSCFFMIYEIGLLAVQIFNDLTSLRDTYDSLYTPRHAKPIGKHTSEVE